TRQQVAYGHYQVIYSVEYLADHSDAGKDESQHYTYGKTPDDEAHGIQSILQQAVILEAFHEASQYLRRRREHYLRKSLHLVNDLPYRDEAYYENYLCSYLLFRSFFHFSVAFPSSALVPHDIIEGQIAHGRRSFVFKEIVLSHKVGHIHDSLS